LIKWSKVLLVFGMALASAAAPAALESNPAGGADFRVTILYDNTVAVEGTRADWGFAALVEGGARTILFDTGTQPDIFWHNVEKLGVDLSGVDLVVLSHEHGDHTGGMLSFLEKYTGIPVYFGASFSKEFEEGILKSGAKPIRVKDPVELCPGILSTGEMSGPVFEQSLIFDQGDELTVMTGCAHPGVADIVDRARELHAKPVAFVFGGFHLMRKSRPDVDAIIGRFTEAGVVRCGATHCTGEEQIGWFRDHYRKNFVPMGVGRVITISR